jgi:hypothetical protein
MTSNDDITKALTKAVEYYRDKVNQKLAQGNYPSGQDPYRSSYKPIEKTAEIKPPVTTGDGVSQTITYGGKDAPYTAAFEFGSGIHDPTSPGTYPITSKGTLLAVGKGPLLRSRRGWKPVNKPAVYASKKFVTMGEDVQGEEVFLFQNVDHPGIKPRPFAVPTLKEEQKKIAEIVGQEVVASIIRELKKI